MRDYLGIKGKTCVVTGAASGMGKTCAETLVELGARVFALDVAQVAVPGIEASVPCNLGDRASIDAAFAALPGRIDKFFGFAGVSGERCPAKDVVAINFVGNQYLMRTYLAQRVPAGGAILTCASIGANRWYMPESRAEIEELVNAPDWDSAMALLDWLCDGLPASNAYTISKRALCYFTMRFAVELAPKRVRVNVLKPGNTRTGLTDEFQQRFLRLNPGKTLEDYNRAYSVTNAMAEPREMSDPAIFLNSDMASYISGVELTVDYGQDAMIFTGQRPDSFLGKRLVKADVSNASR